MSGSSAIDDPAPTLPRPLVALAVLLVLAGVAARVAGCFTDFWLDEVWTWKLAAGLSSPLQVLTGIHHSNNHHLNTLFVYLIGTDIDAWQLYRLPSLLAGLGALALLVALAARRGRLEAWIAAVLGASSYLLVFHASEARGYALVVFFALLALAQVEGLVRSRGWGRGLLFGATVLLGFLSHLQFVHVLAAVFVWSLAWAWRDGRRGARLLADLTRWYLPAAVGLGALYLVDVRHLQIGKGPPFELLDVLGSTAALALGVPRVGWLPVAALALFAVLLVAGLARLARRGDTLWILHLVAIVLSPTLLLAAMRPEVLFERYFVIGHAFWLLLVADLLAGAWRAAGARRALAAAFLLAMVVGNGFTIARYLRYGRGTYHAALEFIARESPGGTARVTSDNDFQTALLIEFHRRFLPPGEDVVYVSQTEPPTGVDWVLASSRTESAPPSERLRLGPATFDFVRRFPHGSHSGWDWFLFRRVGAPR